MCSVDVGAIVVDALRELADISLSPKTSNSSGAKSGMPANTSDPEMGDMAEITLSILKLGSEGLDGY